MRAHPCHIAVVVLLCINVVLIGITAIWLDWTKASSNTGTIGLHLFAECVSTSAGSQSGFHVDGCVLWDKLIDELDLSLSQSNGNRLTIDYCSGFMGGPSNSEVKNRVNLAGALIVLGGLSMIVHAVVCGLWAFGVIRQRWVRIITSIATAALLAGGGAAWQSFTTMCNQDFCTMQKSLGYSCGMGAGIYLMSIVVVIKFLCFIPMRCIKRPCDLDAKYNTAATRLNVQQGAVAYTAVEVETPQYQYQAYASQPAAYAQVARQPYVAKQQPLYP